MNSTIWSTGPPAEDPFLMVFQTDGNLVINSKQELPLWASRSMIENARTIVLRNEGVLNLLTTDENVYWSTEQKVLVVFESNEN